MAGTGPGPGPRTGPGTWSTVTAGDPVAGGRHGFIERRRRGWVIFWFGGAALAGDHALEDVQAALQLVVGRG
jgi:hypothetical protein